MSAPSWLLRGGRVVDPSSGRDEVCDIVVRDGLVAAVGRIAEAPGTKVFDAAGLVVTPGLIDLHVHLREPGFEAKETIATGTAAAAAGGFTTICCMPNTNPTLDTVEALNDLRQRVGSDARVKVHPIAAITRNRLGHDLVDFASLAAAGAIGFSDDGDTTADSALMRAALMASTALDRPIMVHCEDKALATGSMHEGDVSHRLDIAGIPAEAEEIIIARDVLLARLTGGWLHVCHVSTGHGAELIRRAKAEGVRVTAEVMPHHLTMSDDWVAGCRQLWNVEEPAGSPGMPADPHTKVNPPLRTVEDTGQLVTALQDGTIDVVATDHAPHATSEKHGTTFDQAAFGMNGLELALPTMLALVRAGHLTLPDMIAKLSLVPARLLRLPLGTLAVGSPGDLVAFDPDERWTISPASLKTKSPNTPLLGMELQGRVKLTLVGGEERHHA